MVAAMSFLLNGLLVGASGYAMYSLTITEYPYAYTACALGLCHGVLGLIHSARDEENRGCTKIYEVSTSIMEIVPLPLINIDLFKHSETNGALALGHGLFIIPLAFELVARLFSEDGGGGEDGSTAILIDLTVLGNIVSCLYLAVNDRNYFVGGIAGSAFFGKYGAAITDTLLDGAMESAAVFGSALMYGFLTQSLVGTFIYPNARPVPVSNVVVAGDGTPRQDPAAVQAST